jgi:coenzyme F420-reducing hydrogenase gamma subunit
VPEDIERIQRVRKNSRYLITIGACATAGGIQALRNTNNVKEWNTAIYPNPEFIDTLTTSTAISQHIKVDYELWGCPVNTGQVIKVIRQLLFGVEAYQAKDSVCLECKRDQNSCLLVKGKKPCLGPVTSMGCGALCPKVGAACYGCYGPSENPNTEALIQQFRKNGMSEQDILKRFKFINSEAEAFNKAYKKIDNNSP